MGDVASLLPLVGEESELPLDWEDSRSLRVVGSLSTVMSSFLLVGVCSRELICKTRGGMQYLHSVMTGSIQELNRL